MKHKRVTDVMTREVVTVSTTTTFRDVVRTLRDHGISGAPVLDADGHVTGIVSEADLLGRQARTGGAALGWIRHLLSRSAFARSGVARTAADLMNTPVVTVSATDRLTSAAATLARHDVKRAPVLDARGELVGIVSRKDILSVYLRPDEELAAEIRIEILTRAMCIPHDAVSVEVADGVVTVAGEVERQSMVEIVSVLIEGVDGVVAVHNRLTARTDDTHLPPPVPDNVGVFYSFTHPRPGTNPGGG
ncbi:CBS domain-containing protein [Nocardia pseudobrasiliensis]|uniref:BON domain-containing protein n=1 Tax=Nocardia pseudobrasiliensis TaxID=45979 RepID=A0A370IDV0_9NOCA|nr:CBS domain-containing protein [Nocardia pseudobrasiliensis]RDI68321.1 BON domain-containing protein [Nocardia pseudobrasiliensis]